MFIIIMVLILGTCAAVLSSIYFNTTALQKTYGSVNTYYWAYYWAISSIERGLLMTKMKYPTYEWSGWFIWDTPIWARSNSFWWDFWRLSHSWNTMLWSVNSKTNRIVWIMNNKTLRTFSFVNYTDRHPNEYSSASETTTNWINNWLTFSGNIVPWRWWTSNIENQKMDFNWFFDMIDSQYTVRWLLRWNNDVNKRSNTLTWNFDFWVGQEINSEYKNNPRPTTTGARSTSE